MHFQHICPYAATQHKGHTLLTHCSCGTRISPQAGVDMLNELELEHRKLSQLADKARQLRAQNAQMAQEVSRLPELKTAAAELQQQVVELQHVKQQIQRLQVRAVPFWQFDLQGCIMLVECTVVMPC
jgi:hypothetical protein